MMGGLLLIGIDWCGHVNVHVMYSIPWPFVLCCWNVSPKVHAIIAMYMCRRVCVYVCCINVHQFSCVMTDV